MVKFSATGHVKPAMADPFMEEMPKVADLIGLRDAQRDFNIDGTGSCIAILDSGLRTTHLAFKGRVEQGFDFLSGTPERTGTMGDRSGHGTHVAGIAAASRWQDRATDQRDLSGLAPGANLLPLKVLDDGGFSNLDVLEAAFSWLGQNAQAHGVSVVCMSITDMQNHQSVSSAHPDSSIVEDISKLVAQNIPVVAAAGNYFNTFESVEGLGFPAILPDVISVGSVFDDDVGPMIYSKDRGAACTASSPDQVTPYSQRFVRPQADGNGTIVFAPGGIVTSVGHLSDNDVSSDDGTSQATPVVAGLIALMQEAYSAWYTSERKSSTKMSVADIAKILRGTAKTIKDEDLGRDNVTNSGKSFYRVDALEAVRVAYEFGKQSVS